MELLSKILFSGILSSALLILIVGMGFRFGNSRGSSEIFGKSSHIQQVYDLTNAEDVEWEQMDDTQSSEDS